jgi:hypothetical protein
MRWRPQAVDDQQTGMRPSNAQNKKNRAGFDFFAMRRLLLSS